MGTAVPRRPGRPAGGEVEVSRHDVAALDGYLERLRGRRVGPSGCPPSPEPVLSREA